jgi:two-component system chemotaxis response regulator CheY
MRALVVDDFITMRRVVRSLLRETGFADAHIVAAANGAAALDRLRDETFDVVVTDVEMPTLGGLELLSAIRRDARWRHLPVLMVTAEARKDEIVRCTQAGATAYLVKPFARAVLEEKLRSALPGAFASNDRSS